MRYLLATTLVAVTLSLAPDAVARPVVEAVIRLPTEPAVEDVALMKKKKPRPRHLSRTRLPRLPRALPRLRSNLPRLKPRLPRLSAKLPRLRAGLPRLDSRLPRLRSGLPRLGNNLPRLGRSLPRLRPCLPRLKPEATPSS
jgi:hypothetical protein